jgi:hypothetical protein
MFFPPESFYSPTTRRRILQPLFRQSPICNAKVQANIGHISLDGSG